MGSNGIEAAKSCRFTGQGKARQGKKKKTYILTNLRPYIRLPCHSPKLLRLSQTFAAAREHLISVSLQVDLKVREQKHRNSLTRHHHTSLSRQNHKQRPTIASHNTRHFFPVAENGYPRYSSILRQRNVILAFIGRAPNLEIRYLEKHFPRLNFRKASIEQGLLIWVEVPMEMEDTGYKLSICV